MFSVSQPFLHPGYDPSAAFEMRAEKYCVLPAAVIKCPRKKELLAAGSRGSGVRTVFFTPVAA